MRWVLAFATLVFFFAGCRGSSADDACPTHTFQLACEVDKACRWNAKKKKCSGKTHQAPDPCSANMSAWYCDNDKTDKCDWDYKSAKCKRAKADSSGSQ